MLLVNENARLSGKGWVLSANDQGLIGTFVLNKAWGVKKPLHQNLK